MTRRKKGFTLIELLVVIAIIALLMSILMPALSAVKKQAQSVACMSRLKSWGLIYKLYTDDNNGYLHRRVRGIRTIRRTPGEPGRTAVDERLAALLQGREDAAVPDGHAAVLRRRRLGHLQGVV